MGGKSVRYSTGFLVWNQKSVDRAPQIAELQQLEGRKKIKADIGAILLHCAEVNIMLSKAWRGFELGRDLQRCSVSLGRLVAVDGTLKL